MIPLSDLFEIKYGHSLELNKLKLLSLEEGGVAFVSRKSVDNGISEYVAPIPNLSPAPAGELTCALSGNGVLSTFIQETNFYTGFHVARLVPKVKLTKKVLLYYSACIKVNNYRFCYGRQANRTLKNLLVPSLNEIPKFVEKMDTSIFDGASSSLVNIKTPSLELEGWNYFQLSDYFDMKAGKYIPKDRYKSGHVPYVSASNQNNGVMQLINLKPEYAGNSLTIGKVNCVAYYQPDNFCATSDVTILIPKFKLNKYIGLFLIAIINQEGFKWSYGRQIRLMDSRGLKIKLPVACNGDPDWQFMETYIKSLPYSSQI